MIRVMDVATGDGRRRADRPRRYSPVAWLPGGKAYYYVRRLAAEQVPAGEEQYHRRVWLHRVGADPDDDVADLRRRPGPRPTTTASRVAATAAGSWSPRPPGTAPRNDVWIADLSASTHDAPDAARSSSRASTPDTGVEVGRDGRLYVSTDRDAPRGRLCVTTRTDPTAEHWRDLIARGLQKRCSTDFAILDGPKRCERPRCCRVAGPGTPCRRSPCTTSRPASGSATVPLPGVGSVGGVVERPEGGHEAWFGYTDHATPSSVHRYDAPHRESRRCGPRAGHRRGPGRRRPSRSPTPRADGTDGPDVRHVAKAGPSRLAPAPDHPLRLRRLRPAADPGVLGHDPGLGRGRRRLRDRRPARRRRGGRGLAPRRHARQQAERLRRLPRRGRVADRERLDHHASSSRSPAAPTAACSSARR